MVYEEDGECGYFGTGPKRKTSHACPLEDSFSKHAFHLGNIKCLQPEAAVQGKGNELRFSVGRWKFKYGRLSEIF